MKGFLQRILQEIMKKIILGTSDAWSMRRSSHRPSDPAYYIKDCPISNTIGAKTFLLKSVSTKVEPTLNSFLIDTTTILGFNFGTYLAKTKILVLVVD